MKSIVVGTAGHIDHGKSALVQALTGTDPDRLKEEKARGITIDLGFAHTMIGDINVAFVDVPGHERFVKNMLAGVGGIDLVVLVVAADESVMPQTREHFDICRLLRVPVGLIALTKADLVDAETLELVRLEVRDLVAGSFLETAPIIPVSSRTGQGLDAFRAALADAARNVRGRPAGGATRLPIDRVFSMKGFGTVVTGTLVSGHVRVDDELVIVPGHPSSGSQGRSVKVRGVQVHGVRRDEAVAGQRSAVNLGGVDVDEIERGQSVVTPGAFETTRLADAVLELLPDAKPLKHGARVRFHQGTAEILARVALVGPLDDVSWTDARVGPYAKVPAVPPGSQAFVRLRLERPAVLTRGDRYIIRAYSPPMTIGGGQILDPRPPRTAIRTNAALERCQRLDLGGADAVHAVIVMIEGAGMAGLPLDALVSRAGIEPAAVDALAARSAAVRAGDALVTPAVFERLMSGIVDLLRTHHGAQPLSDGMPREEARERVFAHGHPAVFEKAVEELAKRGTIVGRDRLALASHRVSLSPDEERARVAIEQAFREGGLKPPDPATLASQAGVPPAIADRVFKLLHRQKVLVKVDTLLFHEAVLKRLKQDVAALKSSGADARLDVAAFKQRFGVTRKFAIPLLEYLDRERVTRRVGESRVVL
jgi:selenocysteine-specific elongation factor